MRELHFFHRKYFQVQKEFCFVAINFVDQFLVRVSSKVCFQEIKNRSVSYLTHIVKQISLNIISISVGARQDRQCLFSEYF